MTRDVVAILIAHPKAAQFGAFLRLLRQGRFADLASDTVRVSFASIKRAEDLQAVFAEHRPDILVVHGSLLGVQPAYAAMWFLTEGSAGILITDDSDPSRQFQTKRCHVLPVTDADEIAAGLIAEARRVRGERAERFRAS